MKKITDLKPGSRAFMEAMATLMRRALESPKGLMTLAAAVQPAIAEEIERKIITSLLLTEHKLPAGEEAKYQVRKKSKAYWIADGGEAMETEVAGGEITVPTHRIAATPMVDIGTLKHGNIGTLDDVKNNAATAIRKRIDRRTITVLSAAVPSANEVTCQTEGAILTETCLNEGIAILEDQELMAKWIIMRGQRFVDMKGFDLDPVTKLELREKGVIKTWGGASILLTAAADLDEVIILPDEEVGKYPIKEDLTTDALEEKKRFKTGWLAWMQVGQIVTLPERTVKIIISEAP